MQQEHASDIFRLHIPLNRENSSSKDRSSSWGLYLAVAQSEYMRQNRGLKGRVRADEARQVVSEAINPSANAADLRCGIPIGL